MRRSSFAASEFGQPWRRVKVDGHRCELQILDPEMAFAIEPQIIDLVGEASSLAIVAPGEIVAAALRVAGLSDAETFDSLASESVGGPLRAVELLRVVGGLTSSVLLQLAALDPAIVLGLFDSLVMGRLAWDGEVVVEVDDWGGLGLSPRWKWHVMALQVRQTFGPLWTRSPYNLRATADAVNVREPTTPVAVRYAANLARIGYAPSADDILKNWTPVRMIQVIEEAAFEAERTRVAQGVGA